MQPLGTRRVGMTPATWARPRRAPQGCADKGPPTRGLDSCSGGSGAPPWPPPTLRRLRAELSRRAAPGPLRLPPPPLGARLPLPGHPCPGNAADWQGPASVSAGSGGAVHLAPHLVAIPLLQEHLLSLAALARTGGLTQLHSRR